MSHTCNFLCHLSLFFKAKSWGKWESVTGQMPAYIHATSIEATTPSPSMALCVPPWPSLGWQYAYVKNIGFLHGFDAEWGNPYTSCGTSVVSPQVSIAYEGDMTEVPQRVYGWPIQSKPFWNPFLTCFQLISNKNSSKMQ